MWPLGMDLFNFPAALVPQFAAAFVVGCAWVCHPWEDFCPSKLAGVARLPIRAGSNNGLTQRDGPLAHAGLTQNVM
jgi:hypothetical protein